MRGAETSWRAWRFDNKGRYPRKAAVFVKSLYMDAFEDGAETKQHNEMSAKLEEILEQLKIHRAIKEASNL